MHAKMEGITSSNSCAEIQHEQISDIVKESLEVTGGAAKLAQTMPFRKVESEEKLIKDSRKFHMQNYK